MSAIPNGSVEDGLPATLSREAELIRIAVTRGYLSEEMLDRVGREIPQGSDGALLHVLLRKNLLSPEQYLEILGVQSGRAREGRAAPLKRAGRFELKRRIGRGGMGTVYEAYDPKLKRPVAIKLLREEDCDAAVVERLRREAEICAGLQHPNIVSVHEVGTVEDESRAAQHFIVMDLIEGETLADALGRRDRPIDHYLHILRRVADALGHVHRRGVVHRDVKPGNVLVDATGRPFLSDFGLARMGGVQTRLTGSRDVLGTPGYMAPEQVAEGARHADARADVWALGVILYEILVGRPPFSDPSPVVLLKKIQDEEPRRPAAVRRSIPRDLEIICLKAMEKDRRRRYATAADFAEDLRRYARGEPILARAPSRLYRLRMRLLRRRGALAAAAAALLLGGTGAAIVLVRTSKEKVDQVRRQSAARLAMEEAAGRESAARGAYYRFLQETKISPLTSLIAATEPWFYVKGVDHLAKLRRVEKELRDLEAQSRDSRSAHFADIWIVLGIGWYLVGERAKAEKPLLRAERLAPTDWRVPYYLARIHVDRFTSMGFGGWGDAADRPEGEQAGYLRRASAYVEKANANLPRDGHDLARHLLSVYRAYLRRDWNGVRSLCREGLGRFGSSEGTETYRLFLARAARSLTERIREATAAIERRPYFPFAFTYRGLVYRHAGRWKESELDFTEAIRQRPRYAEPYHERGLTRKARKDYRGAVADFSKALEIDPLNLDALNSRGASYQAMGKADLALRDYEEVLRRRPNSEEARCNRGLLFAQRGDWAAAAADFDRAVGEHPTSARALVYRAYARYALKRWDGVVEDCGRIIGRHRFFSLPFALRGDALWWKGEVKKAIADYQEAFRRCLPGGGLHRDLLARARAFLRGGGGVRDVSRIPPAAMMEVLRLLGSTRTWSVAQWLRAGRLALRCGDGKRAQGFAKSALDRAPDSEEARELREVAEFTVTFPPIELKMTAGPHGKTGPPGIRVHCHASREQLVRGEGFLAKYLERHPEDGHARLLRAKIRLCLRKEEGAAEDLAKVVSVFPLHADAYSLVGILRWRKGDRKGARVDYKRALRVAPPDWPERKRIEEALAAIGTEE